ncbi:replication-associated protein [Beak and feather disease virus]|uniref:Replication-associated protein n=1 Tax=Beak and feather disease virus TaxID=77856 RepID=A0A172C155_BFDV|nr:replication-associated protein [Beak and feather disease virus]
MPSKEGSGSRRWCFTLNNPTDGEIEYVRALSPDEFHYAIVGREKGEQGTPHLQGYFHFKNKKRLSALKKMLPRAHFERAMGSDLDNEKYCSKEGDVILTLGIVARDGHRAFDRAVAAVMGGSKMRDVAREFPDIYVRHGRGLHNLSLLVGSHPRDFKTEVDVVYGPPGCGKSRWANEQPGTKFYKMRGEWWDGYDGEDIVIIDDFYGWLPYCEMLRLMDRYPHKVPVKGAFVEFTSKRIIITSNKPPQEWYKEEYDPKPLFRRFTRVWWCPGGTTLEQVRADFLAHPINF